MSFDYNYTIKILNKNEKIAKLQINLKHRFTFYVSVT